MQSPTQHGGREVAITYSDGGWRVLICEDGEESCEIFDLEEHARSFADGQRIRLGLMLAGS